MSQATSNSYVLQKLPSIAEAISLPLKNTQRIKYNCFDVSEDLIIFGASSGGIYVFNRNPCEFVQLIPNKNGPITNVAISPGTKYIGFANIKGLVSIIAYQDKTVGSTPTLLATKHHIDKEVTCLAWGQKDQLFIGDISGNVSVLSANYTVKSIFNDPGQIILNLDSKICQIDLKCNMLVASTLTKTFICDTIRENYRQIGIKSRDGEYGACFMSQEGDTPLNSDLDEINSAREIGSFYLLNGKDDFMLDNRLINTQIFCARPGLRLWEANIEGVVKNTHQFRHLIATNLAVVYTSNGIYSSTESNDLDYQYSNFGKLVCLDKDVLFSHSKQALYFLNIKNPNHSLWYNKLDDILDCKLSKDDIFIWKPDNELIRLKYVKVDKLLLQMYLDKNYDSCLEICKLYKEYFQNSTSISSKLHIVANLLEKVENKDNLEDVVTILERFSNLEVTINKFGVNSIKSNHETVEIPNELIPDDIEITECNTPGENEKETKNCENINICQENSQGTAEICTESDDQIVKSLYDKFKCVSLNDQIDKCGVTQIFEEKICDIFKLCEILESFGEYCSDINIKQSEIIYRKSYLFLLYIQSKDADIFSGDEKLIDTFIESCVVVNKEFARKYCKSCECGYPLPGGNFNETIIFEDVIEKFLKRQWLTYLDEDKMEICKVMPRLWRNIIELRKDENLENVIDLVLQFMDKDLLISFQSKFTEEICEKLIKSYSKLTNYLCLKCCRKFDSMNVTFEITWDDIAAVILKSIGVNKTLAVLENNSGMLDRGCLTMKFHHTLLFASKFEKIDGSLIGQLIDALFCAYDYLDARNEVIKLLKTIYVEENRHLKNTALPLEASSKSKHWGQQRACQDFSKFLEVLKNDECVCKLCYLPLVNEALLKDIGLFSFICGHVFHGVCLNVSDFVLCPTCDKNK